MNKNTFIENVIGQPHGFDTKYVSSEKYDGAIYYCVFEGCMIRKLKSYDVKREIEGFSAEATKEYTKNYKKELKDILYNQVLNQLDDDGYPTFNFVNHITPENLYSRFLYCITYEPVSYDDIVNIVCNRYKKDMTKDVIRLVKNSRGKYKPTLIPETIELLGNPFKDVDDLCTLIEIKREGFDWNSSLTYYSIWYSYNHNVVYDEIFNYIKENKMTFIECVYTDLYAGLGPRCRISEIKVDNLSIIDGAKEIVITLTRKDIPKYGKRNTNQT